MTTITTAIDAANLSMDMGNSSTAWSHLRTARRLIDDCTRNEMAGVDFAALRTAESRHNDMNRAEINAKWAYEAAEHDAVDFTG